MLSSSALRKWEPCTFAVWPTATAVGAPSHLAKPRQKENIMMANGNILTFG
jgi:hypothetical protein